MTQKPHGVRPFPSLKERPMLAAVSTHSLTHQRAGDRWNRRSFSLPVFPEPSQPKSPKSNHLLIYRFLGRASRYKVTPFWSRREAKKSKKKKKTKRPARQAQGPIPGHNRPGSHKMHLCLQKITATVTLEHTRKPNSVPWPAPLREKEIAASMGISLGLAMACFACGSAVILLVVWRMRRVGLLRKGEMPWIPFGRSSSTAALQVDEEVGCGLGGCGRALWRVSESSGFPIR